MIQFTFLKKNADSASIPLELFGGKTYEEPKICEISKFGGEIVSLDEETSAWQFSSERELSRIIKKYELTLKQKSSKIKNTNNMNSKNQENENDQAQLRAATSAPSAGEGTGAAAAAPCSAIAGLGDMVKAYDDCGVTLTLNSQNVDGVNWVNLGAVRAISDGVYVCA